MIDSPDAGGPVTLTEGLTGLDFFRDLDDLTERVVEEKDTYETWQARFAG